MKESRKFAVVTCADARRLVHEQLDGPLEDAAFRELSRHLVRCAECRAFQRGIGRAVSALRAIPTLKFGERSLDCVWDRTIRSTRRQPHSRRRASVPWVVPAAAALLLALGGSFALWRHAESSASPSEEARAAADLRIAGFREIRGTTGGAIPRRARARLRHRA
ncbi:MAG: zf-HC2 domain-containing protein, partial [Planctomycetes bacterium]|nr:zf-HC2 domain-containing protein [Planctomycetota bacterium]